MAAGAAEGTGAALRDPRGGAGPAAVELLARRPVFSAPLPLDDPAASAVRAALEKVELIGATYTCVGDTVNLEAWLPLPVEVFSVPNGAGRSSPSPG